MNIFAYEFRVYSFLYVIKYIIVNDYLCHLCGVILTLKSNGCDRNIPEPWSVVCSKNDPIPNPLEASKYVIIKKKDLCQCSLSVGTWFIQENIVHCEDEASSDLQLYYTVNMAVMIYDFIKEIEEDEVRDISLYEAPVKYDPVEIDLVDVKTDKVIGETYERLAFQESYEEQRK